MRHAVQVTSTPWVSTLRRAPEAGSISSSSPATIEAIAADRLDDRRVGAARGAADPAELDVVCAQRARLCARPDRSSASSAPYQAPSPAPAETIATSGAVAAPGRLPYVHLERRCDRQLAARDVEDVEAAPALAGVLARLDERHPVGQVGLRAERARAERVRLLGALTGDQQQDARAVGRPLVVLDDAGRLGERGAPRRARRARARRAARCPRRGDRRGRSASAPSGDQRGPESSLGPCVICRMPEPSAAARQMRPCGGPRARRAGRRGTRSARRRGSRARRAPSSPARSRARRAVGTRPRSSGTAASRAGLVPSAEDTSGEP